MLNQLVQQAFSKKYVVWSVLTVDNGIHYGKNGQNLHSNFEVFLLSIELRINLFFEECSTITNFLPA